MVGKIGKKIPIIPNPKKIVPAAISNHLIILFGVFTTNDNLVIILSDQHYVFKINLGISNPWAVQIYCH